MSKVVILISKFNCPPVTGSTYGYGFKLLKRMIGKIMSASTNTVRVNPIATFFQNGYCLPNLCFM